MKKLIATFILALYEGISLIWAFCPIKASLIMGIPQNWVFANDELIGQLSFVNLMVAIVLLCFLCYNQGLQDGKR